MWLAVFVVNGKYVQSTLFLSPILLRLYRIYCRWTKPIQFRSGARHGRAVEMTSNSFHFCSHELGQARASHTVGTTGQHWRNYCKYLPRLAFGLWVFLGTGRSD